MTFLGEFRLVEFVDGRIHAAIDGEEIENVSFFSFVFLTTPKWIDVDIFGSFSAKAFVMDATNGEGSIVVISMQEFFVIIRLNKIVAIDETNIIACHGF